MSNMPQGATHADYGNHSEPVYHRKSRDDNWEYWSDTSKKWVRADSHGGWVHFEVASRLEPLRVGTSTLVAATAILEAAASHMKDRAATYDRPAGERSMGATVKAFEAVTGVSITEEQGWLFMQLLKAVRSQQGAYRADSYEDGAAYVALAGEAAARDRQGDRSC